MRRGSTRFRRSLHSDVDRYYGADAESSPVTGAGGSLENQVTALNPFAWFRADSYTPNGATIAAFVDKMDAAHTLAHAAGVQANAPTADAALNSQLSATIVGPSAGVSYLSSKATSAWRFLHDGTGAETFSVYVNLAAALSTVWSTFATAATGPGARFTQSTDAINQLNSGAATYGTVTNPGVNAVGVGFYNDWAFQQAMAPNNNLTWNKSVAGAVANFADVPNPGDSSYGFRLGANSAGSTNHRFGEVLIFNRVLTAPERATVQAYMLERYAL